MSARRNHRRRDWPRGLYEPRPGYYVFRTPAGEVLPIGRVPLAFARNEALAANAHLADQRPQLVDRLAGVTGHTVADLLGRMPVSERENTAKQHRSTDKRIAELWGRLLVPEVSTRHVAEALDALTDRGHARAAVQLRTRLVRVFRKGQALGWCKSNPAEATERPRAKVKRGRLTLESFRQVQEHAPEWMRYAMTLALVTGADESTLVTMHRRMVADGHMTWQRVKTGVWVKAPLHLRLDVLGVSLAELVPARIGLFVHDPDPHGNAGPTVTASRISKAFTAARKAAGLPSAAEGGPSFHEIRSLAKRLYEAQGNVDTLALLGHADERTGEVYADPRGVEPVTVKVTNRSAA